VTAAAFAPTAAVVAYAHSVADGFEVDEAGLDGRRATVVLRGSGGAPTVLRWSPRDGRLAYVRNGELHVAERGSDRLLWSSPAPLELGGWMPDASALVVSTGGESYLVDSATGVARDLGRGEHAVPSPDGTRVALAVPQGLPPVSYNEDVDVVSLADGTRRTIFHGSNPLPALAWSPDSRQVAFLVDWDVEPDLLAQNADGSSTGLFGRQQGALPTEIGMDGPIAWTANGIAGFARGDDATLFVAFYEAKTGKTVYSGAVGRTIADIAPAGAVAYLNRDGLRLVDWNGRNDRTLFPCRGTPHADRIRVSVARTTVLAGAGNDVVDARNARLDTIDCGPGRDIVWADRRDILRHCEVVHRR
jgi:hypothetical protein